MNRHPAHGRYLSAAPRYDREDVMSETPPVNPPQAQASPEPLVKAETVRMLILAVVAAGGAGTQIPDPVLAVVVPIATTLIGVGVSWGLTTIARGKVWALRNGVDVDAVVDEVQARTR